MRASRKCRSSKDAAREACLSIGWYDSVRALERGRMEDSGELFHTLPPSSPAMLPLRIVGDPGGVPGRLPLFGSSPFSRLEAGTHTRNAISF